MQSCTKKEMVIYIALTKRMKSKKMMTTYGERSIVSKSTRVYSMF